MVVKLQEITGKVSFDFSNNVVIVTGAARGIGRATVNAFVEANANVVAADIDAPGLSETCTPHTNVVGVVADISSVKDSNRIVDTAVSHFGGLDICVNNAAVAPHTALMDESVEIWDKVYSINCRGTFLMTQAAARVMIEKKRGGRIINFSSAASKRGSPGTAAYASSRAATESFSRVAAIELAPYNILVNTISPGLIDTQPKPLPPVMAENLKARIPTLPLSRAGLPDEVVKVVLFLASDAASNINGAVINVDGGASVGTRHTGPVIDDDPRYVWLRAGKNIFHEP
jgi:NAD(P)-dependent dehydrogenase (short-subunit alcohol dehydrogenase family)